MTNNDHIEVYTISMPVQEFKFDPFISEPAWCDVSYTFYITDFRVLLLLKDFNEHTRTFTFEYHEDLALLINEEGVVLIIPLC